MPDEHLPVEYALTLEQWRRLNLTRPYTDDPIGGNAGSLARRAHSASASRIVTPSSTTVFDIDQRDPTTATRDIRAYDRLRRRLRNPDGTRSSHPVIAPSVPAGATQTVTTHPDTTHTPQDAA